MDKTPMVRVKSAFELFRGGDRANKEKPAWDVWNSIVEAVGQYLGGVDRVDAKRNAQRPKLERVIMEISPNFGSAGATEQHGAILAVDLFARGRTVRLRKQRARRWIDGYLDGIGRGPAAMHLIGHAALAYARNSSGRIDVYPCACTSIVSEARKAKAKSSRIKVGLTAVAARKFIRRVETSDAPAESPLRAGHESKLRADFADRFEQAHIRIRQKLRIEGQPSAFLAVPIDTSPVFASLDGRRMGAERSQLGSLWFLFVGAAILDKPFSYEEVEELSRELRNIVVRHWIPHFMRTAAQQADEVARRLGEEDARLSFAHQVQGLAGGIPRLAISEPTWHNLKQHPAVQQQIAKGRPAVVVPAPEMFDMIKRLLSMWALDNTLDSLLVTRSRKDTISGILREASESALQLWRATPSLENNIPTQTPELFIEWHEGMVTAPDKLLFEMGFDDHATDEVLIPKPGRSRDELVAAFLRISHAYFGNMLRHAPGKTAQVHVTTTKSTREIMFENQVANDDVPPRAERRIRENLGMRGTEALRYYADMVGWKISTNERSAQKDGQFWLKILL